MWNCIATLPTSYNLENVAKMSYYSYSTLKLQLQSVQKNGLKSLKQDVAIFKILPVKNVQLCSLLPQLGQTSFQLFCCWLHPSFISHDSKVTLNLGPTSVFTRAFSRPISSAKMSAFSAFSLTTMACQGYTTNPFLGSTLVFVRGDMAVTTNPVVLS